MNEIKRIIKLFDDLYQGSPWIDVNITGALEKISAKKATKKIATGSNSIWEIVNHLISWRFEVLQRVQGNVTITPDHNFFLPVVNTSEAAWNETLNRLKNSQQQWINFFEKFNERDFENVYPNNNMTYYEHIHGILQHDAYHLGQITLLSKLV